jgi:hypothetical protein
LEPVYVMRTGEKGAAPGNPIAIYAYELITSLVDGFPTMSRGVE